MMTRRGRHASSQCPKQKHSPLNIKDGQLTAGETTSVKGTD